MFGPYLLIHWVILFVLAFCALTLIGNLIVFNWAHHLQKAAQQWSDKELDEKLKRIPGKERQEAWRRVARRHAPISSSCSIAWSGRWHPAPGSRASPIRSPTSPPCRS